MGTTYLNEHVFDGTPNEAIDAAESGDLLEVEGYFEEQLKTSREFDPKNKLHILGHGARFDGHKYDFDDQGIIQINGGGIILEDLEGCHSHRGISFYDATDLIVRKCLAHNTQDRGIGGSGRNILVEHSTVRRAVLQNENNKMGDGGWAGALSTMDRPGGKPSENIDFFYNLVEDVWGEGLMMLRMIGGKAVGNVVRNAFSVLMYFNKCQGIEAHHNLLEMTKDEFKRPRGNGIANNYGANFSNESAAGNLLPMMNGIKFHHNWIRNVYRAVGNWHKDTAGFRDTYFGLELTDNYIGQVDDYVLYLDDYPAPYPPPHSNVWGRNFILNGAPRYMRTSLTAEWEFFDDVFVDELPPWHDGTGFDVEEPADDEALLALTGRVAVLERQLVRLPELEGELARLTEWATNLGLK